MESNAVPNFPLEDANRSTQRLNAIWSNPSDETAPGRKDKNGELSVGWRENPVERKDP